MKLPLAAALIVTVHAVLLLSGSGHGMTVSYVSFFSVATLALTGSLRAWLGPVTRDHRWALLVVSLVLWGMGMALAARQSYVLDNPNPAPGDSMFFYVLYVLPVLAAISSAPVARRRPWALAVDLLLAALLGVLFYVRTFSIVSLHGADDMRQALDMAWMLDIENACLALAALLRFVGTDRPDDHRFFRAVAAFFVTGAVAGFFYNHGVALAGHPQFGTSPWDILLDLPFLALCIATGMRTPQRHWHPPVSLVRFVQAASPTFLAMGVLGCGLLLVDDAPELGITSAIIAVMGIGVRGTLAQADLADEEHRVARNEDAQDGIVFVDSLTGLGNRRAFDQRLLREWRRPGQRDAIALLLIDLDFFKEYNHRYGHAAGDDCLRAIAAILVAHGLRAGDFMGRFGGEEFAVIAPATRLSDAVALAEELRARVESLALVHPTSPFGVVTITVGVALLVAAPGSAPVELMESASRALHRAKQAGRNRVGATGGAVPA